MLHVSPKPTRQRRLLVSTTHQDQTHIAHEQAHLAHSIQNRAERAGESAASIRGRPRAAEALVSTAVPGALVHICALLQHTHWLLGVFRSNRAQLCHICGGHCALHGLVARLAIAKKSMARFLLASQVDVCARADSGVAARLCASLFQGLSAQNMCNYFQNYLFCLFDEKN